MSRFLSAFECASIQPYIFGSSRSRENVGASYLVRQALEEGLVQALPADSIDDDWKTRKSWLDSDKTEVLYVGGGNAVVSFPSREDAVETTWRWSKEILRRSPGLRPVAGHVRMDGLSLGQALSEAFRELDRVKMAGPLGWKLECLPITRPCTSTYLAAVKRSAFQGEKPEWLSTEALRKREALDAANAKLRELLDDIPADYEIPKQFEHLVEKDEGPHIGVVHIDGNGIGVELQKAGQGLGDQEAARNLRDFSIKISAIGQEALKATTHELVQKLAGMELNLSKVDGKDALPMRPIVFGGDDLTLVCNGRIAIGLAASYLRNFSRAALERGLELTASAGVLICRSHFPFDRAYRLVEEVTGEAKVQHRKQGGNWLDFQVLFSGATGSLRGIRSTYEVQPRRPWQVTHEGGAGQQDLTFLTDIVLAMKKWPRWRRKELRDAYQLRGEAGVSELLRQFESRGVVLPAGGYKGQQAAYVDALEAEEFMTWS